MLHKIFIPLLLLTFLASCSADDSNANQTSKVGGQDQKEHMLSDQEKLIEKAKATEKALQEADEKRRKALEDQGG